MRTFNWDIEYIDCLQTNPTYPNIITFVKWGYTITDENDNSFTYDKWTSLEFDENNFTPYTDLVVSDVIGWLEDIEDMEQLQADLNEDLDEYLTPSKIRRTLPSGSSSSGSLPS